jgi:aerobic carbon-monoxide dehydrogenase medium subunit
MKPAPFDYHAPTSVSEAVELLSQFGDDAKVLAGGQSLVPMLALRLARFDHLVDLGRITELRQIERSNGTLRVGAMVPQAAIERNPDVAAVSPLLARATPLIGHFQIRNRGTVGGSLAHADPAAEYPAVALALDVDLEVAGASGSRRVAAQDFFLSTWTTVLAPDELLVAINFPIWAGRVGFSI